MQDKNCVGDLREKKFSDCIKERQPVLQLVRII